MKYLVVTDIHGNAVSADIILEKFKQVKADKIILLGDYLNNGPRNGLPERYDPQYVAEVLNRLAENIIAIKGNCDSEVDQMMFDFTISENAIVDIDGKQVFLTHGHHINPNSPAKLAKGTLVVYGHFHNTKLEDVNGVKYLNISSITFPKHGSEKCYGVLDKKGIMIYNLDDKEILSYSF